MTEVPIAPTRASSSRSTLELLSLPWPFGQVRLLKGDEFIEKANEQKVRGEAHRLDERALEELHRARVLVPFFRVRLGDPDPAQRLDVGQSLTPRTDHSTVTDELFRAAADGRLTDPSTEPFAPWSRERQRALWPTNAWGFVYSHHQLHGLRRARGIIAQLRPSIAPDRSTAWELPLDAIPNEETVGKIARWRGLAVVLSALDTVYWPQVTREVSHEEVWREVRAAFDPASTLAWLGVTVEEIGKQADDFRVSAMFGDVLGDFFDIVRRAKPSSWATLRGPALVAMEDRIAAEVFHRTAEDINPTPQAPAGTLPQPLSHQWLGDRPNSLDAALTDLFLSPFPAVVLALEGETEMSLMPRVFRLLGIPENPNFIRIECFGGTNKDLQLLARFASAPLLGTDWGESVDLDRPLTHFLVLTDAENKYSTAADRRRQRKLLLDSITYALPADLKADYYRPSADVVEIRTWGRLPFEFAHFRNAPLARALLSASGRTFSGGQAGLEHALERQRRSPSPNVERAWQSSGISKVELAEAMWPLIEARVRRAIARGTKGPPIMANALRAYKLAVRHYGHRMRLSRQK